MKLIFFNFLFIIVCFAGKKNTPYVKSVSAFRVEIIASRAIIVVNASSNCQLNSICLNQICDPEIIKMRLFYFSFKRHLNQFILASLLSLTRQIHIVLVYELKLAFVCSNAYQTEQMAMAMKTAIIVCLLLVITPSEQKPYKSYIPGLSRRDYHAKNVLRSLNEVCVQILSFMN